MTEPGSSPGPGLDADRAARSRWPARLVAVVLVAAGRRRSRCTSTGSGDRRLVADGPLGAAPQRPPRTPSAATERRIPARSARRRSTACCGTRAGGAATTTRPPGWPPSTRARRRSAAAQQAVFANLVKLPLTRVALHLLRPGPGAVRRAPGRARAGRLGGRASTSATGSGRPTAPTCTAPSRSRWCDRVGRLAGRGGHRRLTGATSTEIWDLGPLTVQSGRHSVVIGLGLGESLKRYVERRRTRPSTGSVRSGARPGRSGSWCSSRRRRPRWASCSAAARPASPRSPP